MVSLTVIIRINEDCNDISVLDAINFSKMFTSLLFTSAFPSGPLSHEEFEMAG